MISIDNLPVEGEHKKKQEKSTIQNIVFTQGQKVAIEGLSEFIDKPFDESFNKLINISENSIKVIETEESFDKFEEMIKVLVF